MSPSKWILTIGGIVEVLLLCLLVNILASKKKQSDFIQPTKEPVHEKLVDSNEQAVFEV